ncbi:hypothetical protein C3Z10_10175 [Bacillus velezensis]|uniref:Uncharacterized protein n=1 Tax=Bacillus velezensis TaxID=492670 RepID=A0ABC8D965_BACVE|nr:hypothetical protein SB24_00205 [Bacillus sp. Pc3]ANB49552.1 hypothetical protein A1D33_019890 [Bacillus velezensis]AQP98104.1 hypothetical protein BZ167_19855 [Bacillus sp. 275]CUB32708.1 hypothetical protein BN2127_JRS5_02901 [Bacillus amyloliquefaciens]AVI28723.1 hypothetical protein C3Z10_10175 [Bacillus velezensis]
MSELSQEQTCPYCDCTEEASFSNWDSDSDGIVTCTSCYKEYYSMPQYRFEGWQVEKICEECGHEESECHCEGEEK